jgi:hypothetical protein
MSIPINCWAIVISMIVSVVLGFLWYGPLFGKKWMALSGIALPDPKPSMKVMIKPIIISLIGAFFMAFALSHALVFATAYLNVSGISAGLQGAFWNWLGFVVPVTLAPTAWEGKSWVLWCIHAGYWLVLLLIMGIIISVM